jgi:protein tyrosine phosphatase (PTP) superfamily phosphohydrolase (DUF442 family)
MTENKQKHSRSISQSVRLIGMSKRVAYSLTALAVFCLLGLKIYEMSVFRPMRNFHVVEEGKFYRSAQPTTEEFKETIKKYGIKTVINLRGRQPGETWFEDETKTLGDLRIKMVNIGFSTEHVQRREEWLEYLDTLKTAERPIWIHCRSGADRTSEASAVYAIEYMGQTKAQAMSQLGYKYLHVPLFIPAKKYFIDRYQGPDWIAHTYSPCLDEFRKFSGIPCPAN